MKSYGNGWVRPGAVATQERVHPGHIRRPHEPEAVIRRDPLPAPTVAPVDPPMTRNPDYDTSHEGAAKAELTKENIQQKLLVVWYGAGPKGFTDEEAAEAAGLTDTCFWKRAGELRAQGKIKFTDEKRRGRKGVARKVSAFVTE